MGKGVAPMGQMGVDVASLVNALVNTAMKRAVCALTARPEECAQQTITAPAIPASIMSANKRECV